MLAGYVVLGELSLDGTIAGVAGALSAAIGANAEGKGLICPFACGPEAAWAGKDFDILAPRSLIAIANHFRGTQVAFLALDVGEVGQVVRGELDPGFGPRQQSRRRTRWNLALAPSSARWP